MNKTKALALAKKIIQSYDRFVLATASRSGKPQVAFLSYANDRKVNLYFYTLNDSRKYKNLITNPRVGAAIYSDVGYLQLDGVAKELRGIPEHVAQRLLIARIGKRSEYHDDPRVRYFRLKPTWIRVRVRGEYPPEYCVVRI